MHIEEPVPTSDIPKAPRQGGRYSPYEGLFQRVLQLNGLALPVVCDDSKQARNLWSSCKQEAGRGHHLGLTAVMRKNTVYLHRRLND